LWTAPSQMFSPVACHVRLHYTLAPSIQPLLEAPEEGFFWNLLEFGLRIRFDGWETCPLESNFQSVEQPKVTRSEIRRVRWFGDNRNCCTTRDVWLGALSWCRNRSNCLPLVVPQPLQNLHVEMTRRYELILMYQSYSLQWLLGAVW
jgi:hypothetical protein